MAEQGTLQLALKIVGGKFDDFCPYELTLDEGFSQVSRGELTVLTKTCRDQKALRELINLNATLVISQRLEGGLVSRSRYFHGVITRVTDFGAAAIGNKENCCRHVIIIESEPALLGYTSLSCPYYNKTPPDVIGDIFNKYSIRAQFPDKYIDNSRFSKKLMFEQSSLSDLEFVKYLMRLYGISWNFVHGKAAQNGIGTADFYFSEGSRFPAPFYEYSDKRKIPDIENFDFFNYDNRNSVWKMAGWSTQSAAGVEGMTLTASYPESNHGSPDWCWGTSRTGKRYYSINTLFHGYERKTPPEEIDADIKLILEVKRIANLLAQEGCSGKAENIILAPGLLFTLKHFHGLSDASAFTALVTDSALHIRLFWPQNMAVPPAETQTDECAWVEFNAAGWGPESEKRFCEGGGIR